MSSLQPRNVDEGRSEPTDKPPKRAATLPFVPEYDDQQQPLLNHLSASGGPRASMTTHPAAMLPIGRHQEAARTSNRPSSSHKSYDSTTNKTTAEADPEAPVPESSKYNAFHGTTAHTFPFLGFKTQNEELYGYAFIAIGSIGYPTVVLIAHFLESPVIGYQIPTLFVTWFRSIIQLAGTMLYISTYLDYKTILSQLSSRLKVLLLLRGLFGSAGMIATYAAIAVLPLGEAITFFCLSPIFTMIGTHVLLNEAVSAVEIVASVVAFIGVVLLSHSSFATGTPDMATGSVPFLGSFLSGLPSGTVGVFFGLAAAVSAAAAFITLRKINKSVHFMFNGFSFGLVLTIVSTIALRGQLVSIIRNIEPSHRAMVVFLLILQGLVGFFAQSALSKGLQHCRGVGVLIRNLEVPISYLNGVLFFGEIPNITSLVGTVLILFAVISLALKQIQWRRGRF